MIYPNSMKLEINKDNKKYHSKNRKEGKPHTNYPHASRCKNP